MDRQGVLPPQSAAKIAIMLTAVSAGASLGLFATTWVNSGFAPGLPLLVGGALLLPLGAFMWKGTPNAYVGALATSVGLYAYALAGMSGFLGLYDSAWHLAGLGALSVLSVSVIVFSAVYLRDHQATTVAVEASKTHSKDASANVKPVDNAASSDTN